MDFLVDACPYHFCGQSWDRRSFMVSVWVSWIGSSRDTNVVWVCLREDAQTTRSSSSKSKVGLWLCLVLWLCSIWPHWRLMDISIFSRHAGLQDAVGRSVAVSTIAISTRITRTRLHGLERPLSLDAIVEYWADSRPEHDSRVSVHREHGEITVCGDEDVGRAELYRGEQDSLSKCDCGQVASLPVWLRGC